MAIAGRISSQIARLKTPVSDRTGFTLEAEDCRDAGDENCKPVCLMRKFFHILLNSSSRATGRFFGYEQIFPQFFGIVKLAADGRTLLAD